MRAVSCCLLLLLDSTVDLLLDVHTCHIDNLCAWSLIDR